jgi:hypothetical protein
MRRLAWWISIGTAALALVALLVVAVALGRNSASGPRTEYGSPLGNSLNGTGAFAALLKRDGHVVRVADNLTNELEEWAQVIVRFAWYSGPPPADEARWYDDWLQADPGRKLLYVVHDYEAEEEYWDMVVKKLEGTADEPQRKEAQSRRDEARGWASTLPGKFDKPAPKETWFDVGKAVVPPTACKTLAGPWADGIDAQRAALVVHKPLTSNRADALLSGDGKDLVLEWQRYGGGRVLAVASGSFLLNLTLVNPARRPLAELAAAWIGEPSQRVAFVDGPSVLGDRQPPPTLLDLIARIPSFRWVAVHLGVFGILACLVHAPRLGRPQPSPPSGADRPAAHAEAVGDLLERSHDIKTAHDLLQTYRRWRSPRLHQASRRTPGNR